MKDDRLYLLHVRECLDRIARYTAAGRNAFLADTMVQDAVIHSLQVLTESTQRLSDEIKARHPTLDWRGMAAFRNLVVHNYLGVNLERVWEIIERDVPTLKTEVAAMLQECGGADAPPPTPTVPT
ncbi:MAG: DUF86 domain-containing protein [Planctomycetota bacterium]|nr:DUF86 domain-containing protein [Planctomycetota bacterium]